MPPCKAEYLARYLFQIGPTNGDQPIPHAEIESFQRNTGINFNAWESATLRRLSVDYISERHESRNCERLAPYTGKVATTPQMHKAEKVRNSLRALADL